MIPIPLCVSDVNSSSQEHQPPVNTPPSSLDRSSSLSTSSHVESSSTSNWVNTKKKKRNINKKKGKILTQSEPTTLPSESVEIPTKTTHKPKLP